MTDNTPKNCNHNSFEKCVFCENMNCVYKQMEIKTVNRLFDEFICGEKEAKV
jgi:hypothetical protein